MYLDVIRRFKRWTIRFANEVVLQLVALHAFNLEAKVLKEVRPRFLYDLIPKPYNPPVLVSCLRETDKVAYISIPKAGCTSIRRTFLESETIRAAFDEKKRQYTLRHGCTESDLMEPFFSTDNMDSYFFPWRYYPPNVFTPSSISGISGLTKRGSQYVFSRVRGQSGDSFTVADLDEINLYFIFTFVRNPFSRMLSCYRGKYVVNSEHPGRLAFQYTIFPYVNTVKGFDDFVRRVCKTPYEYLDRHLLPQFMFLEEFKNDGGKIDFVGRLENISKDFEPIRKKYNLLSLERINVTGSSVHNKPWRDWYTPETAQLIYKKYIRDFKDFGYEGEYPELLRYLESKRPSTFKTWEPA